MKTYITIIKYTQLFFLGISIAILALLPLFLALSPVKLSASQLLPIYAAAHLSLFFVMAIRPLADLLPETVWIRPLVILRKGLGVFSASIIVSVMLSKIIVDPSGYMANFFSLPYWSLVKYAVFAHLADVTAVVLLVTSNNFSKRILGEWWKPIQQLSYVYFYCSGLYVFLSYGDIYMIVMMTSIALMTILASLKNYTKALQLEKQQTQPFS